MSNKGGTSNIRIPHNSAELHLVCSVRVVCSVHGLSLSCMSKKKNVLSLILLILLAKLTNQKKSIFRHRILYPLRLGLPFPNNVGILKPNVGLEPDQIEMVLRKVFSKKYKSFMNQISYFWKRKAMETLGHVCACMLKTCVRMLHTRACMRILGF